MTAVVQFMAGAGCAVSLAWWRGRRDLKRDDILRRAWRACEQLGMGSFAFQSLKLVFKGTVIQAPQFGPVSIEEDMLVGVDRGGKIIFVVKAKAKASLSDAEFEEREKAIRNSKANVMDLGKKFLVPGFIDGHAHAPQHAYAGTGIDLPLLQWLERYTFPSEAKLRDADIAAKVYQEAVNSHLRNGTTCVSYFGTIHVEATKILAETVQRLGQRAFVGKVNMDRNCPDYYREDSAAASLAGTEEFVKWLRAKRWQRVTPVLTPRFVPTCSSELMRGLGQMASTMLLPVQSHMSETAEEISWVADLHPESWCYANVYDQHGLLSGHPTYMAHCIHCGSRERSLILRKNVGVVHCPNSNFSIGSGCCDVRSWVKDGVQVCLGTDVAGGYSSSILDAMRLARVASVVSASMAHEKGTPSASTSNLKNALCCGELLFLATLGGAKVLGIDHLIGTIEPGKRFDALVVNTEQPESPIVSYDTDTVRDRLEKFIFLGDDRNIAHVYVDGERVAGNAN
eukprot:g4956.t1